MLNSKINAVRLNMEHQGVIAKKLMAEFKQSQGALNDQIVDFEQAMDTNNETYETE